MGKIIVSLGIFVLILAVIPVYAQSTLAFQEKCAEGAKKLMEGEDITIQYTSHYNKKLDKCFIHVRQHSSPLKDDKGVWYRFLLNTLSDVFGGNTVGECVFTLINGRINEKPDDCYVGNTKCKTIDEFEDLLHPYMED